MRRMYRYGFLDETQNKLDYVLALNPTDVLERRLQVSNGDPVLGDGLSHQLGLLPGCCMSAGGGGVTKGRTSSLPSLSTSTLVLLLRGGPLPVWKVS